VGIASLKPTIKSLGGSIFVIGSPKHHLFHQALRTDSEATVPVSILRLRPFNYVFNKIIAKAEKVYNTDDPRLSLPMNPDKRDNNSNRKRFWDVTNVWTGADFGAGPGGIAVRHINKDKVIVLGVGGGTVLIRTLVNRQERKVE